MRRRNRRPKVNCVSLVQRDSDIYVPWTAPAIAHYSSEWFLDHVFPSNTTIQVIQVSYYVYAACEMNSQYLNNSKTWNLKETNKLKLWVFKWQFMGKFVEWLLETRET